MGTVPPTRTEGGHTCDAIQQFTGPFCSKGLPDYSSLLKLRFFTEKFKRVKVFKDVKNANYNHIKMKKIE